MKGSMNKLSRTVARVAILGAAIGLFLQSSAWAQENALTVLSENHNVHIYPTVSRASEIKTLTLSPGGPTPLTYHGGPVMTKANTYAIFWIPASLQTGAATSLPAHYQNVQTQLLYTYPGHGLDNNNTQYYMTSGSLWFHSTSWVQNAGSFVGSYVDTSPYPASACSDIYTPGNCLTDAEIQAEILKVVTLKGWSGGTNNIFMLYTSSGEGSCAGGSCAYSDYCAYHSYFLNGSTPILYGNIPYANPTYCQVPGTPSPNGDAPADAAANVASHELTEAITDPELNAWYDANGQEIGDKCAWIYGTNTWDSALANQSWYVSWSSLILLGSSTSYFELQEEYNNHTNTCVQVGP